VPLDRYREKRDFTRTPEPPPGPPPGMPAGGRGRFMVHRHRATRLHYDLRLEIGGALASWAVPHGPSRDPGVKRLAVHVEDHPVEYFDFEGTIPKGEYGAGDSICWDWGTFQAEETWDPADAVARGELKFRLWGEKLVGRWTLIHTGGRARGGAAGHGSRSDADWLLIAKRGPDAVEGWDADAHPASVKSGLTNEEVAAGMKPRISGTPPAPLATLDPPGARSAAQPVFLPPMLATPGTAPFDDPDWVFEPKWDGYRLQAIVSGGRVALRTRNGADGAAYFPELLGPPTWLAAPEAIVDGELVALDASGRPDFGLLQGRTGRRGGRRAVETARAGDAPGVPDAVADDPGTLVFMAFDLPWCAGRSYLGVALEERKEVLRLVLRDDPRVRYASHLARDGVAFYAAVEAQGLEGAMAKLRRSPYTPSKRSTAWLKLKVRPTQELVVGGYVRERGGHGDLGALVVGVMEDGRLRYAGRVGSGMDAATRRRLQAALDAGSRPDHPFTVAPGDLARTPRVTWAEPVLVIRSAIAGWTRDGMVRQPSFDSEAPDVDPATVERQVAVTPGAARDAAVAGGVATPGSAAVVRRRARSADAPPAQADTFPAAFGPPTADELAALAALPPRGGTWSFAGREVTLTNLDRVLAPGRSDAPPATPTDGARGGGRRPLTTTAPADEPPITKRDLVAYFARIAPVMLPHLADRAINVVRFPDGLDQPAFWQRAIGRGAPAWVTAWREPDPPDRQPHEYVVADSPATLAWLGNMAAVELHPWTSLIDRPDEPRWALVDIDPGTATTWEETLVLTRLFRTAFDHLGIVGAPKVTGKRGIQVFVPLRRGYTFEETREWVERVSRAVGAAVPDLVSWEWSKDRRDGRARLDFTQNWRNRTLVAAYSPRPAPGLPVSAPIAWDELDDPALRPDRWTVRTILERVEARGDLFAPALGPGQSLPRL
jgi:bifunctional non-homologous end joining protein LigD